MMGRGMKGMSELRRSSDLGAINLSQYPRAGLIEDGRVENGIALYAAIVNELRYVLEIPEVDLIAVDLSRNEKDQQSYLDAAMQNSLTRSFRFAQSQARFLVKLVQDETLMDTVLYFHQVKKMAIDGIDRVCRWIDLTGLLGCFGWNDQDFINQVKFLDQPR